MSSQLGIYLMEYALIIITFIGVSYGLGKMLERLGISNCIVAGCGAVAAAGFLLYLFGN